MKFSNFCKGAVQVVGGLACVALTPVEMLCDILGADIDCPLNEWDERHDAVEQRQADMDYYDTHGADWCFSHAGENFRKAFR